MDKYVGDDVKSGALENTVWMRCAVTLVALLIFGAIKARFTGVPMLRGALQTMLVRGIAAGAAFVIARLVSGIGGA